jgi:hypothetical protein
LAGTATGFAGAATAVGLVGNGIANIGINDDIGREDVCVGSACGDGSAGGGNGLVDGGNVLDGVWG